MSLAPLMSSAKHDWRTPASLFRSIEALAGVFDLDAAADSSNHLAPRWFSPAWSAMDFEWVSDRTLETRVWLNPPYGRDLPRFVSRAVQQVCQWHGMEVWMLVPARPDTRWWNLAITRALEVRFIAGRVKFERPDGARDPAPFPSAVIRLRHDGGNPSVVWGWRP